MMLLWARSSSIPPGTWLEWKRTTIFCFSKRLQGSLSGDSFLNKAKQINKQLPHTRTLCHPLCHPSFCSATLMHWYLKSFYRTKGWWKLSYFLSLNSTKLIFSFQWQCGSDHRSYLCAAAIHQVPSNCPLLYKATFLRVYTLMSIFFLFSSWELC